jgi:hypothetical protein
MLLCDVYDDAEDEEDDDDDGVINCIKADPLPPGFPFFLSAFVMTLVTPLAAGVHLPP